MEHITIQNFKYGLDSRKSELTSQPGTLVKCENAHINQGGEVEKRKGFVLQGTLPVGCFGLQETNNGIFTFGSGAASIGTTRRKRTGGNLATLTFGASHGYQIGQTVNIVNLPAAYNGNKVLTAITNSTVSYVSAGGNEDVADMTGVVTFPVGLPTGVSYQRLRHYYYDTFAGGGSWTVGTTTYTYSDPYLTTNEPAMTGVSFSCSFNNKLVAVASFAASTLTIGGFGLSAGTFLFYDGRAVVEQSLGYNWGDAVLYSGSYLEYQFLLALSHYFGSDFTGTPFQDTESTAAITGPASQAFTLDVTDTSQAVNLTSSVVAKATNPTVQVAATSTFYLTGGVGGSILGMIAPSVVNGAISGTVDLIGGVAVPYATSLLITAQNMAARINSLQTTTGGYVAQVLLNNDTGDKVVKIIITAPLSWGSVVNTSVISVTSANLLFSDTSTAGTGSSGTTNHTMNGGVNLGNGTGQVNYLVFTSGNWERLSSWTGILTTNQINFTVAAGNIGGLVPTYVMALGNKLYFTSGTQFNFSKVGDPTHWEDQDTGAGFVSVQDQYASPTNLVALSPYQGKLAVFGRRAIQIYSVNADPALYAQTQSLQNIGTLAKLSPQPVGEIDVLFLSDTGVRSLRVRDNSLNAYVVDVGSPIDSIIQDNLVSNTASNNAAACAIVEPSSNRYWLHLNGTIYVLSYYPSLKISAWSTYLPTYEVAGVAIAFSPVKFLVYAGQVYCLAADGKVFLYGGADNNTYDSCIPTLELPWLDHQTPFMKKNSKGVDICMTGPWTIQASMDPYSGRLQTIYFGGSAVVPSAMTDSTFDNNRIPFSAGGTHFKLKAVGQAAAKKMILSSFTFKYEKGVIV